VGKIANSRRAEYKVTSVTESTAVNQILPRKSSVLTTRTKVLLLTDSFLPHAGGSREYYNNIYRRLTELGDSKVTVLTKKVPGWKEFDKSYPSEFFHVKRFCRPLASLKYEELPKALWPLLGASWHIFRERPAIIHAGDLYPPGLIAFALKRLLGLPYVIYCHGEEITQTDRYRYQPRVRDGIYKYADAVIANSEFARAKLIRIGVQQDRIHKITPGVDSERFRPMPPRKDLQRLYRIEGKTVLLTVARLFPRKGHRLVLQALAKIACQFPNVHYLIAGTGPDEQQLRRLAHEAGLDEHITFTGFVGQEKLPDIYNLCDVMVMPNREEDNGDVEGFGMVFLEANATGKPVIGGRSGGAVEAIAEGITGFLVNPNDAGELAVCLQRLLLDPSLRDGLGSAGLQRARSEFSWNLRAERLREINRSILNLYPGWNMRERLVPSRGEKSRAVGITFVQQAQREIERKTKCTWD
jgi:phosphatidyl-myo-inositol dimannoside synthase